MSLVLLQLAVSHQLLHNKVILIITTSLPMLVLSIVALTDLLDELSSDLANRTPTFSVLESS